MKSYLRYFHNNNKNEKVNFIDDEKFRVNGLDLETTLDLLPWDAGLGSEVTVDTIDGKILVKIPMGIQTDGKIRVAGKGYRDTHGRRGALYISLGHLNYCLHKTP